MSTVAKIEREAEDARKKKAGIAACIGVISLFAPWGLSWMGSPINVPIGALMLVVALVATLRLLWIFRVQVRWIVVSGIAACVGLSVLVQNQAWITQGVLISPPGEFSLYDGEAFNPVKLYVSNERAEAVYQADVEILLSGIRSDSVTIQIYDTEYGGYLVPINGDLQLDTRVFALLGFNDSGTEAIHLYFQEIPPHGMFTLEVQGSVSSKSSGSARLVDFQKHQLQRKVINGKSMVPFTVNEKFHSRRSVIFVQSKR